MGSIFRKKLIRVMRTLVHILHLVPALDANSMTSRSPIIAFLVDVNQLLVSVPLQLEDMSIASV